jgi:mono/diheme cytochrome c family protein
MENRRCSALVVTILAAAVGLSAKTGALCATAKKKVKAKKPAASSSASGIAKGKQFVQADGCTGCHTIGGKGGKSGPDLSKVGAKDKASEIATKIKNPKANNPNSIMPASHRPDKEIAAMASYLASLK